MVETGSPQGIPNQADGLETDAPSDREVKGEDVEGQKEQTRRADARRFSIPHLGPGEAQVHKRASRLSHSERDICAQYRAPF